MPPGVPTESPGSEASTGSPFDVDKQLAKMRMLAAKSPGAMDWATRPMFESIDGDDGNDTESSEVQLSLISLNSYVLVL